MWVAQDTKFCGVHVQKLLLVSALAQALGTFPAAMSSTEFPRPIVTLILTLGEKDISSPCSSPKFLSEMVHIGFQIHCLLASGSGSWLVSQSFAPYDWKSQTGSFLGQPALVCSCFCFKQLVLVLQWSRGIRGSASFLYPPHITKAPYLLPVSVPFVVSIQVSYFLIELAFCQTSSPVPGSIKVNDFQ